MIIMLRIQFVSRNQAKPVIIRISERLFFRMIFFNRTVKAVEHKSIVTHYNKCNQAKDQVSSNHKYIGFGLQYLLSFKSFLIKIIHLGVDTHSHTHTHTHTRTHAHTHTQHIRVMKNAIKVENLAIKAQAQMQKKFSTNFF